MLLAKTLEGPLIHKNLLSNLMGIFSENSLLSNLIAVIQWPAQ